MTRDKTYLKVKKYITQHQMIGQGDFVAAGVSGGADSVCLLYLLKRLQEDIPYRLSVVHVNHKVREDADQDAAYVEKLCEEMGIPCYLREVDMYGYAREHKLSPEEAGRILRYQIFQEVTDEQSGTGCGKIAVAHNANDRAETMLFHMFRGSGLEGMSSIRPVRDQVIRPVLCLTREEIENFLKEQNIACCQDSTNEEDTYARNRIRHHILPYAESAICMRAIPHMNDLADIVMETEDYLSRETKRLFLVYAQTYADRPIEEDRKKARTESRKGAQAKDRERKQADDNIKACDSVMTGGGCQCLRIRGKELLSEDPVMIKRVLLYALEQMTPHRKDITGQHIADLVGLLSKDGSKELSLPYEIKAYKEYDMLILQKEGRQILQKEGRLASRQNRLSGERESYAVEPPEDILIPDGGCFSFMLLDRDLLPPGHDFFQKGQNIPQNRYTKWFDYDKITTSLLLRTRKTGDYLTIDKALHTQSLKQYMINEKIPKMQRDSMYILADGAHVLWIPEYRTSQYYGVDESTKCILQVQLRGGYHGGTS